MTQEERLNQKIKIFYDADCPICNKEMCWLKSKDSQDLIELEDISSPSFDHTRYGKTKEEFQSRIHAQLDNGQMIEGVEVFQKAYSSIGLGWLLYPTKFPIIKQCANLAYAIFARYRKRISSLF